jgi:acylphosphatase
MSMQSRAVVTNSQGQRIASKKKLTGTVKNNPNTGSVISGVQKYQ